MENKRGFVSGSVRKIDENAMTIEHVINTKTLDRYSTIVLPKGAEVTNFLNNPVVLWFHNVDDNPVKIPIGKCIELTVKEDKILAKTKFNEKDPLSVKIFNAYKDGFLNAWSIGFQPLKYTQFTKENYKELNSKYKVNVTTAQIEDARFWGVWIYTKWDLHEYSAVPVPANPDALNSASDKEAYRAQLTTRGLLTTEEASKVLEATERTLEPIHRVRQWASTDGSGDKEKIDWDKYKLAFAYYDEKDIKNFDSYKLLHCDIVDGELKVITEAVISALCELDEGVADTPKEELQAIRAHLTSHCAKEEPEIKTKAVPSHEKEEKPEDKVEEKTEEKEDKEKVEPKDEAEAIATENEEETDLEKETKEDGETPEAEITLEDEEAEGDLDLEVTKETEEKLEEEATEEEPPKGGYKIVIDDIEEPEETKEETPEEKVEEKKAEKTSKIKVKKSNIEELTEQVKTLTQLVKDLTIASDKRMTSIEKTTQLDNIDVIRALDSEEKENKTNKKTQGDVFDWGSFINRATNL